MADGHGEAGLQRRVNLAIESKSADFIQEAARELMELATQPSSFVAAAQSLAQIGKTADADAAIDQGLTSNPHDSELVLAGARQRFERGELSGALSFLHKSREDGLTIADRIKFDELRAAVAEKRGDTATAAALRSHARNLARLASQSSLTP
jgi:hypothetical protein